MASSKEAVPRGTCNSIRHPSTVPNDIVKCENAHLCVHPFLIPWRCELALVILEAAIKGLSDMKSRRWHGNLWLFPFMPFHACLRFLHVNNSVMPSRVACFQTTMLTLPLRGDRRGGGLLTAGASSFSRRKKVIQQCCDCSLPFAPFACQE
ncbi:hypothetical protein ARMSODRAFT_441518 [Armillaria solidipes]|uniref:Uncharacterized protein n=1 Tax=Armillaria solidipes TaxID=1076256 RepID=A0A2H3BL97_9AGAR|nr:hypothetical protein ARMSODRAFT_441518 [Armillaria solidipes]